MKPETKILVTILVSAILALGVTPVAEAAKLVDPPPSQWGCELSDRQALQGISGGLLGRGWVLTSNDGEGNLVAQTSVRGKHTLIVAISYTSTSFDIDYKDSDNLKYKRKSDGTETIHRNANSWMNNILMDIGVQLRLRCEITEGPENPESPQSPASPGNTGTNETDG